MVAPVRPVIVDGASLQLPDVELVAREAAQVELDPTARQRVERARGVVNAVLAGDRVVYGVNTGFGHFSDVIIDRGQVLALQRNLVLSHAAATGPLLGEHEVRAVMLLRANALAKGYSGVRPLLIDMLCRLLNQGVHPVVPAQGSVGASGDLAPLAHVSMVLIGKGEAFYGGQHMPGAEALARAGLEPVTLEAKEGLALINGTQVMSGLGCLALQDAVRLARAADIAAALSVEALRGIDAAFDARLVAVRPHSGPAMVTRNLRRLLDGSGFTTAPAELRVQDAYSLRCVPQVHGATRAALAYATGVLETEVNSATDNPLVFPGADAIISGGNFHGQPLALALDFAGIAAAELGSISERRTDRMLNPAYSGLPAFLTPQGGLHSGLMLLQYTAAALVSENKLLASPASVDSIPTSGNQEDHVSMGSISASKFRRIVDNLARVLAIELICATQAVDLRPGLTSGVGTACARRFVRGLVLPVREDRSLSAEIGLLATAVRDGSLERAVGAATGPLE